MIQGGFARLMGAPWVAAQIIGRMAPLCRAVAPATLFASAANRWMWRATRPHDEKKSQPLGLAQSNREVLIAESERAARTDNRAKGSASFRRSLLDSVVSPLYEGVPENGQPNPIAISSDRKPASQPERATA